MEHQLKVRIETGPGIPFYLSQLNQRDARMAILKAIMEVMMDENKPPGATYEGQSGPVTAYVSPTFFDGGSDGVVPATFYTEMTATVRIEGGPDAT